MDAPAGSFAAARPGAGDCLNIREQPSLSAGAPDCVADGVLLELTGRPQTVDGVTWVAVRTPAKRAGWASLEFLR